MSATRYTYATASTRDKAEAALEDGYATGDILPGERPRIERHPTARGWFIITLEGGF